MTPTPAQIAVVDQAIASRMSARAFRPDPVPRALIEEILQVASRAPSGTNAQPWQVHVLTGARLAQVVQEVCAAYDAVSADPQEAEQYREPYDYYPSQWVSPYLERRRQNGWALYELLGIAKGDKQKMHDQHRRNFTFFDAPVGLIFTMDPVLGRGSFLDYGMFLQNIMVAARARGLHTCAQGAWNRYHRVVFPIVGVPSDALLVCGMALGWADEDATVNRLQTPRAPVSEFTHWVE